MDSRARAPRVTGEDREVLARELVEGYLAGASIRELAAGCSRSYGFVHGLLSESGVELRGRGGATRGRTSVVTAG
ncbi:MAG: helix-turn-helix domain-containing protein [Candidatus Nanopelagicales bacterium]